MYGTDLYLEKNTAQKITKQECEELHSRGVFHFKGQRLQMTSIRHDTFQVNIEGASFVDHCVAARFLYGNTMYGSHVLRAQVEVNIHEKKYPSYNGMLYVDYDTIPLSQQFYIGSDYTLVW